MKVRKMRMSTPLKQNSSNLEKLVLLDLGPVLAPQIRVALQQVVQ
jgi:hypothetical protein